MRNFTDTTSIIYEIFKPVRHEQILNKDKNILKTNEFF